MNCIISEKSDIRTLSLFRMGPSTYREENHGPVEEGEPFYEKLLEPSVVGVELSMDFNFRQDTLGVFFFGLHWSFGIAFSPIGSSRTD